MNEVSVAEKKLNSDIKEELSSNLYSSLRDLSNGLRTTRLKISLLKKEESILADFVNDTGKRNLISFQLRRWQPSSEIS
ncbi:2477_t:CDS:2 [Funneliformis geosporum]|nr:2477_t:CDS:2 [Funneliformis geosporum]